MNEVTINKVKKAVEHYKPIPIKRVYIPKPGKSEKRKIGIPSVIDRIIQECIKSVIEPILEAQFFDHSYGFRPMRDCHMAIQRVADLVHKTGHTYVIEGDISKCFDHINHNILTGCLFNMGIRDKRILMIIKVMVETGIMNEITGNELGIAQGGTLSPLLANVYLNKFDKFITREWEEKHYRDIPKLDKKGNKNYAARKRSRKLGLKPAYFIRYADDWCIITNSYKNAVKLKYKTKHFLKRHLKLQLSEEKTKITNMLKRRIKFLGVELGAKKGNSRSGIKTYSKPDIEKLKKKIQDIRRKVKEFRKAPTIEKLIHKINLVNATIRGVINYYQITTQISLAMQKPAYYLQGKIWNTIKRGGYKVKWIPANKTNNMLTVHKKYRTTVPAIIYKGMKIGVTSLNFAKWKVGTLKNTKENPYTKTGREHYVKRMNKKFPLYRKEFSTSLKASKAIANGTISKLYNFEFFMNKGYAINRDRYKCRLCGRKLEGEIAVHHINPKLPLIEVNRVVNLATLHKDCHLLIHSKQVINDKKIMKKVQFFRNKLEILD